MPALADHLDAIGVGRGHASKVFRGLHRTLTPLPEVVNLGRHAQAILDSTWQAQATIVDAHTADDTTEKLVIDLHDGSRVEAVLVPMQEGRHTLCVSSQVGCAMACSFCATGTLGLTRDLKAGEIVAQVHAARRHGMARGVNITRLVFMGMGEPLHAYASTRDALRVLMDPHGLCMGSKQICVSTVGLVPRMKQFSDDFGGRVLLALSLHAGTDATRRRIVPTAKASSITALRQALLDHPLPGTRKLMLEYVVLPGVNDTPEEMDGVAAFSEGLPVMINLIPFNPFPGSTFRSPELAEVQALFLGLRQRGLPVAVRWPRGRGAHGACGQLALRHEGVGGSPAPVDALP